MTCQIFQLPAFEDNYIYLLKSRNYLAAVDPGDPKVVLDFLEKNSLQLTHILNTHHHHDHIRGNENLKKLTACDIIAPQKDLKKIPQVDQFVSEGETIELGDISLDIIEIPGHTQDHIAYYDKNINALFCGDTLFSIGCGRIFDGSAMQLWNSLLKIKKLPDNTQIYCAHEYTLDNTVFALSLNPRDVLLQEKLQWVKDQRGKGLPTVPSLLGEEKKLNPFLNCPDFNTFVKRRSLKDCF